jgi:cell division protein FtsB
VKLGIALILFTTALILFCGKIQAQEAESAASTLEDLRMQLIDLDDNAAQLRIQLERLNSDLDPDNIRRHFSAVGSTNPEQLREGRRRELQAEKDRLVAHLDQLAARRTRLEAAIADAQAKAYQQSAMGQAAAILNIQQSSSLTGRRALFAATLVPLLIGAIALWLRRQRNRVGPIGRNQS